MKEPLIAASIARELAANAAMGIAPIREMRIRRGRTTKEDLGVMANFIIDQNLFYVRNLGEDRIVGKSLIEIGPGDATPHALLLIGRGAARYAAFDRFFAKGVTARALALYEVLLDRARNRDLPLHGLPPNLSTGAAIGNWLATDPRVVIYRHAIDGTIPDLPPRADAIVSFNVLEHVSSIENAVANMTRLLKDDGVMLHRIDYGPHDVWRDYLDELTFLRLPDWLWRQMGSNRGYPNRARHSRVLRALNANGLSITSRVTRMVTAIGADARNKKLVRRVGASSIDDLCTMCAEVVCARQAAPELGMTYEAIQSESRMPDIRRRNLAR